MKRSVMEGIQRRELDEAMHLAEGFRRMVGEQAYLTWQKLPPHTRAWLSVEDMLSDGMRWAAMEGVPRWEPRRGALSTWLYIGVRTYFDKTYESRYLTKQRYEGRTISLQGMLLQSDEPRSDTLVMADRLGDMDEPKKIIRDCYVAELIKGIYDESSNRLKEEIKRWFLGGLERVRTNSPNFLRASSEFRSLAGARHLYYEECAHLMHSPKCLDKLSREILLIPYDLEHPTPGLRGQ